MARCAPQCWCRAALPRVAAAPRGPRRRHRRREGARAPRRAAGVDVRGRWPARPHRPTAATVGSPRSSRTPVAHAHAATERRSRGRGRSPLRVRAARPNRAAPAARRDPMKRRCAVRASGKPTPRLLSWLGREGAIGRRCRRRRARRRVVHTDGGSKAPAALTAGAPRSGRRSSGFARSGQARATGAGDSALKVPSLRKKDRAKNRRVELMVEVASTMLCRRGGRPMWRRAVVQASSARSPQTAASARLEVPRRAAHVDCAGRGRAALDARPSEPAGALADGRTAGHVEWRAVAPSRRRPASRRALLGVRPVPMPRPAAVIQPAGAVNCDRCRTSGGGVVPASSMARSSRPAATSGRPGELAARCCARCFAGTATTPPATRTPRQLRFGWSSRPPRRRRHRARPGRWCTARPVNGSGAAAPSTPATAVGAPILPDPSCKRRSARRSHASRSWRASRRPGRRAHRGATTTGREARAPPRNQRAADAVSASIHPGGVRSSRWAR